IRIDNVGDFYDYGVLVGFYALSDRSIVIVDYQPNTQTLCQRLVNVDIEKGISSCIDVTPSTLNLSSRDTPHMELTGHQQWFLPLRLLPLNALFILPIHFQQDRTRRLPISSLQQKHMYNFTCLIVAQFPI
ncbi:hypothetical protein PFISCL1PPCAC_20609, partial [Pristionchus fissidentatus]